MTLILNSLLNVDDIFGNLNGGSHYSNIDLRQTYLHVIEVWKELINISTLNGLYRYNRMAFGILRGLFVKVPSSNFYRVFQGLNVF